MTTLATGFGVVTCAGVGSAALRGALAEGTDFEQCRSYAPDAPQVAIYPLAPFELVDSLAGMALPSELIRRIERVAHRSSRGIQAALLAVAEAWDRAGLAETPVPGERIGLIIGGSNLSQASHYDVSRAQLRVRPSWAVQFMDTDHVGILSDAFGIHGEGFTVGGASASGNVALIQAIRLLESGTVDLCVVIGAMMALSAVEYEAFQTIGAMAAPSGSERCNRPFDVGRRGFVHGEGAGCIILETAASARSRGRFPAARLAGSAMRLDGHRFSDPDIDGEAAAMAQAIAAAGLTPDDIDYVSAHGTGSPLGDDTELAAIARIFGERVGNVFVNSTKSVIGHTLSAAGILESIAALIQLEEGWLHATLGLATPIASSPLIVAQRLRPPRLRHALSNSFGFSGINTSVLWSKE